MTDVGMRLNEALFLWFRGDGACPHIDPADINAKVTGTTRKQQSRNVLRKLAGIRSGLSYRSGLVVFEQDRTGESIFMYR